MERELDWINSRARLFPHDQALIDAETDDKWTFHEVNERAVHLAHFFIEQGIKKGDRIALLSPNHISYFDFLFACMKIGAIFVPLNWRLVDEELKYILNDSNPKLVGLHSSFNDKQHWLAANYELIPISSNHYINQENNQSDKLQTPSLIETDPLAMIYTGGTTGKPKGAVLSHRSIMWNALNTIVSWNLSNDDATLTCLPMFHTGGLNALSIPVLMAGGAVVLSAQFDPEKAIADLIRYECTTVLFVPTMYHMIVRTKAFEQAEFTRMKVFLSGGAPCPLTIYEAFEKKDIPFKEGYGLTEAGPNNFYINPIDSRRKPGSVGKAMMFNEIKIMTADGNKAKSNEVGELLLKGNHAFEFYWNKEQATKETIVDGWLHTGDLARQDEEGYVYIVGRKKEMIITGGENVYPLEIEHWLESHQAINEVAVVGLPHQKWGEVVTAFISLNEGFKITIEELKTYCDKKLSRYKIPKQFKFIDELPKTHVGKIDKKALKSSYSEKV